MIRLFHITTFLFLVFSSACSQAPANRPHTLDAVFDKKVSSTIDFSVPVMGVEELNQKIEQVHLFDTRKKEEFNISHIPGAKYLGYKDFDQKRLGNLPKDTPIVLYCSIGYRSEKIGERLVELGYTNVYNLYGSIFDWVNRGLEVVDQHDQPTQKVHTYNRNWSKWVDESKAQKVW